MTDQDKLQWLVEAGLLERTGHDSYRFTEEGAFICGRPDWPSDDGEEHDTEETKEKAP